MSDSQSGRQIQLPWLGYESLDNQHCSTGQLNLEET
jgi:hypothetical protein